MNQAQEPYKKYEGSKEVIDLEKELEVVRTNKNSVVKNKIQEAAKLRDDEKRVERSDSAQERA